MLLTFLAGCASEGGAGLQSPVNSSSVSEVVLLERASDGWRPVAEGVDSLLRPASTMKLITTSVAVDRGILEASATTEVWSSADRPGWVVLVGGGDPFLVRSEIQELAIAVQAERGNQPILGVIADASRYAGPLLGRGWMWDDEPSPFQARVSALTMDEGCIDLTLPTLLQEKAEAGLAARYGYSAQVQWDPDGLYPEGFQERRPGSVADHFVLHLREPGRLPRGERVSVSDPAYLAGAAFAEALQSHADPGAGHLPVEVVRRAGLARGIRIAVYRRPWRDILPRLNKDSHNLAAECLLREVAILAGASVGTAERGLEVIHDRLRELGVPEGCHRLVDGSGLSHYNLLSAELLASVLRGQVGESTSAMTFRASLPKAGIDGTLRQRLREVPGHERIAAKTGTLGGVANLAGYIEGLDGQRWIFVMLTQNFVGSARPHRLRQDQRLASLLELTRPSAPDGASRP